MLGRQPQLLRHVASCADGASSLSHACIAPIFTVAKARLQLANALLEHGHAAAERDTPAADWEPVGCSPADIAYYEGSGKLGENSADPGKVHDARSFADSVYSWPQRQRRR